MLCICIGSLPFEESLKTKVPFQKWWAKKVLKKFLVLAFLPRPGYATVANSRRVWYWTKSKCRLRIFCRFCVSRGKSSNKYDTTSASFGSVKLSFVSPPCSRNVIFSKVFNFSHFTFIRPAHDRQLKYTYACTRTWTKSVAARYFRSTSFRAFRMPSIGRRSCSDGFGEGEKRY